MAYPQTTPSIALPAPTGGFNWRDPLPLMESIDSPWMLNWEPEEQYLRVRNGWEIHCNISGQGILGLGHYGSTLLAYTQGSLQNHVYDVTTSTASKVYDVGTVVPDEAFECHFGNRMGFTTEVGLSANHGAVRYSGSWAAWDFTNGGSVINGKTVVTYKGRVYIFVDKYLYYSALEAVTGAVTKIDMTTQFGEATNITWAGVLTNPGGTDSDAYLAFGTTGGEILIYGGDNPGATNWGLVAKFDGLPANTNYLNPPALVIKNDILIATRSGLVSVRKLFQNTMESDNDDVTISQKINPYWSALDAAGGKYRGMAYWPEQNKIYVLYSGFLKQDRTLHSSAYATFFVYNTVSKAWTIQRYLQQNAILDIKYFNDNLYITDNYSVMKLGSTFKDEDATNPGSYASYDVELHGAYTALGAQYRNKQVQGFEPIIDTDFSGSKVSMQAAADFGRKVSGTTSVSLPDGYSTPFYSVGVEGSYLQYRLDIDSDTTASDGFKLYSVGVSVSA